MIDAATVTWDPSLPRRRPRLWPTLTGLAITTVVIAGGFAVLVAGLRASYQKRADKCGALDISPVARQFGKNPLDTHPDVKTFDCMAAVGDDPRLPTAIVGLSVVYHDSTFEARLAYEYGDEADKPGHIALPGGKRGRLLAVPLGAGGCAIQAALQDVNITMTAQLSFADRNDCDPNGRAARSLADTMRQTLAKLS